MLLIALRERRRRCAAHHHKAYPPLVAAVGAGFTPRSERFYEQEDDTCQTGSDRPVPFVRSMSCFEGSLTGSQVSRPWAQRMQDVGAPERK